MFSYLRKRLEKRSLQNKIATLYKRAMNFQRNGKIREYSFLMAEISLLEKQLASKNS